MSEELSLESAIATGDSLSPALTDALLALLAQSGTGVALKDNAGRYVYANRAMAGMLACEGQAMTGKTDAELLSLPWATELRAADQRALAAPGMAAGEHQFEQHGVRRQLRTLRVALAGGESPQVLSLWWDDSEARAHDVQLQQALVQIERQQTALEKLQSRQSEGLDRRTALFRHQAFEEHLQREFALSGREHREFSLGLLVLDDVQRCRDTGGAAVIDRIADVLVNMLRATTRSMDMICRLDEDRFGVLLSGVGLATSHTRLEQFRRECATHVAAINGQSVSFTISAGVASFPHTADGLGALYDAAELALAQSRAGGGNKVSLAAVPLPAAARAWVRSSVSSPSGEVVLPPQARALESI